jgi:ComF family protein
MALLDLLMPPACAGCGRTGALLCSGCRGGLVAPGRAQDRFLAPDAGIVIGDALTLAVAALAYAGPMRRALAALKYGSASRLAPILAQVALPRLSAALAVSGPATLVPVPVHLERRRIRGYNQAELIARELAKRAGLVTSPMLVRVRPTTKQHRLNRTARLANLRGAFGVAPGAGIPSTVLIVDDIITTTATLEACASVLREAGVGAVYGFAIAREV